jgi:hypothetical protein
LRQAAPRTIAELEASERLYRDLYQRLRPIIDETEIDYGRKDGLRPLVAVLDDLRDRRRQAQELLTQISAEEPIFPKLLAVPARSNKDPEWMGWQSALSALAVTIEGLVVRRRREGHGRRGPAPRDPLIAAAVNSVLKSKFTAREVAYHRDQFRERRGL